jgi:hypothetical protein
MSLESRIRRIEASLQLKPRQTKYVISGSIAEGRRLAREYESKGYAVSTIIAQGVDFTAWPEPFHGADTVTTGFEVDDIQFPPDYHIDKGDATDGIEY